MLVWGHDGAREGSWGTCGAMGGLVGLWDAHVMSWGAWWGHRVLTWGHGVLLLGHGGAWWGYGMLARGHGVLMWACGGLVGLWGAHVGS